MTFQLDTFQNDAFDLGGAVPVSAFWSYKIDGYELNDGVNFVVYIPEIDDESADDVVLAQIDGDYPVLIRVQPTPIVLSLNVQVVPSNWDTYSSRVSWLKNLLSGDLHTLTVQARGQASPKWGKVSMTSLAMGDPKTRRLSFQLQMPNPNWYT
jgi:hypothetical protein